MENHPIHQTKVLSVNISCCERCPKILKKKLLKMPGVDSVAIDMEKNLVIVTGPIDAMTLVNNVANLGKRVKLLPSDMHPRNKDHHVEEKHKNVTNEDYGCPNMEYNFTTRQKGKTRNNCCGQNHDHNHMKEKEEEEHKCEVYVPPKVDERVCRDYYCKIHPKMRKIVNRVPAESSNWFAGLPFYTNFGGVNPFRDSHLYPGWHGEEPQRFGYYQQSRRMLPRPFGFH